MEIFLVIGRETRLIVVDEGDLVEVLLEGCEPDAEVWLEETDEPLGRKITVVEAGIKHRGKVHVSRCRHIEVAVRYNGEDKRRSFRPATPIARVYQWAAGPEGFDLPAAERPKHTLLIGEVEPDPGDHVGSFAVDCAVLFSLVPKQRFEG